VQDLARVLRDADASLRRDGAGRARSFDLAASIVSEVDKERRGALTFDDFRELWGAPAPLPPISGSVLSEI
jgi:hypothetical protein